MVNNTIQKIINKSSFKEIEEIIQFCQDTLSKKFDIKDVLKEKFTDPRYINCTTIMLAGIYNLVDDKEIYDLNFKDVNEYEDMLYQIYHKSDNTYKRSYADFNDFIKVDLYMQIIAKEGKTAASKFMEKIMESRGWPMTHTELEHSDGGFDVVWIYNKNTDEIYIESIDNY